MSKFCFIPSRIDNFITPRDVAMRCEGGLARWPLELATTENVKMEMVDGLAALNSVVYNHPESIGCLLLAQDSANVHQMTHELQ